MLQQSTLMGLLVYNTKNSSRYIVVHDSQFDKRLCLDQMFQQFVATLIKKRLLL
jgi:hypothetical protein